MKEERKMRGLSPARMAAELGLHENEYERIVSRGQVQVVPTKLLEWGERFAVSLQEPDDYP